MTGEEAIDLLDNLIGMVDDNHESDYDTALKMAIEALEQEPCEDAISRQAVLDAMYELCDTGETLNENPWRDNPHIDAIADAINNLPPVTPQPKTGRWKRQKNYAGTTHICSACNKGVYLFGYPAEDFIKHNYDYCPNCGAYMRGEEL